MFDIKVDPHMPPTQMVLKSKGSRLLVRNIGGNDLESRTKTIMKQLSSGLFMPVGDCKLHDVFWKEANQKDKKNMIEFTVKEEVGFAVTNTKAINKIQMNASEK